MYLLHVLVNVDVCRVCTGVTHQDLHFINWYAVLDADSGEGMPEFVREGALTCPLSNGFDDVFQRVGLYLVVRLPGADPQRRNIVSPGLQVCQKRHFGLIVKIDDAFLVAFAVRDPNGILFPIDF